VGTQTLASVLGQLRFSEPLPQAILDRLAEMAVLRDLPAGTLLFREGATQDHFMIIVAGRVELDIHVPGQGDVRILSLGPGDLIAWSALLGGATMTTSAMTLEDTRVIAVPAADVLRLSQSDCEFGYYLMRQVAHALADRLVATRLQMLDLFAEACPRI